jgi:hypothetical protein
MSGAENVQISMDPEIAKQLHIQLASFDSLNSRLLAMSGIDARPGSVYSLEIEDPHRAYSHDLARSALIGALDHIRTWKSVFESGLLPAYAHWSIIRSAHEMALVAYWLVEPGINPDERRARGIAAQLVDYDERRKVEKDFGIKSIQSPGKSAHDRYSNLFGVARGYGLTKGDRKGQDVLTSPMPNTVDLFCRYEDMGSGVKGSGMYRLQSGYAHGKQWAHMIGAQSAGPGGAPGRFVARIATDDVSTFVATARVMSAVARAVEAMELLH